MYVYESLRNPKANAEIDLIQRWKEVETRFLHIIIFYIYLYLNAWLRNKSRGISQEMWIRDAFEIAFRLTKISKFNTLVFAQFCCLPNKKINQINQIFAKIKFSHLQNQIDIIDRPE